MNESAEAMVSDEPATVSALLIEARERSGLSQEEVADQLFLTSTFIGYIDEAEFHKIPKGTAFIKGYIRSYARVVGLDGDEMVALYVAGLPGVDDVVQIRDVTEETVGPVTFTGPVLQTGLMALGGLVVVVALVWFLAMSDEADLAPVGSAPPAFQPAPVSERWVAPPATAPDFLTDSVGVEANAGEMSPSPEDLSGAIPTPTDVGSDAAAASSELVEEDVFESPERSAAEAIPLLLDSDLEGGTETVPALPINEFEDPGVNIERDDRGDERIITVTADGVDVLDFTFSDDCWVQIEDAANKVIYADLNRGGDAMIVTGTGPFTVLLGKAPVVRMEYNGAPFGLGRYTMSDETALVRTR